MKLRKMLLVPLLVVVGVASFVATANAWPSPYYYGFFDNGYSPPGDGYNRYDVWSPTSNTSTCAGDGTYAMPSAWVYDAPNFKYFVLCKLNSPVAREKTGAAFIISTMLGIKTRTPTAAQQNEWSSLVDYYAANGMANFGATVACTLPNTHYQTRYNDIGAANDCGSGGGPAVIFTNPDGTNYIIKRLCANPVGQMSPLKKSWTATGYTTATNVTSAARGSNPLPGDKINWSHYIDNNGPGDASPNEIWYMVWDQTNNYVIDGTPSNVYRAADPPTMVNNSETFTIPNVAAGTQFCRRLFIDHSNSSGGNAYQPWTCVTVAAAAVASTCSATPPTISAPLSSANPIGPTDSIKIDNAAVTVPGGLAAAQQAAANNTFFIRILTADGTSTLASNNNVSMTASGSGATGTITAASVTFSALNTTGNFKVVYGLSGPSVTTPPCEAPFTVALSPYLSIMGGDIAAGPGFGAGCTNALSGIRGRNLGANGAYNYAGAGSQLGAFVLGAGNRFATSTTLATAGTGLPALATVGGSVPQPSALSFSNASTSSNTWVTGFDRTGWCAPDYYTAADSGAIPYNSGTLTQAQLNALPNGTYKRTGDLAIGSGGLQLGGSGQPKRITFLVTGTVTIQGNITYASYNYISGTTDVGTMPHFEVLAKGATGGTIYVDKSVSTLTGFYVAQKTGGVGGIFASCSTGGKYLTDDSGDVSSNAQYSAAFYTDCNKQLKIYGSVAANHYRLNRTWGNLQTYGSVPNAPAEQVIYTPELWLGRLRGPSGAGAQPFDAITSLPPIL